MNDKLSELRDKAAELNRLYVEQQRQICAMDDRLARLEGKAITKFLHDKSIAGDWLPADSLLVPIVVVDLVYFMYRQCRKWPTVEQVVGQLQRDQRLNETRARQVLGHALTAAEPLNVDPMSDTWLVKIDPAAHDDLEGIYQESDLAWQYTEYPPERIR